jgi:hypothetical protein
MIWYNDLARIRHGESKGCGGLPGTPMVGKLSSPLSRVLRDMGRKTWKVNGKVEFVKEYCEKCCHFCLFRYNLVIARLCNNIKLSGFSFRNETCFKNSREFFAAS